MSNLHYWRFQQRIRRVKPGCFPKYYGVIAVNSKYYEIDKKTPHPGQLCYEPKTIEESKQYFATKYSEAMFTTVYTDSIFYKAWKESGLEDNFIYDIE
jgi:hypothetical protein